MTKLKLNDILRAIVFQYGIEHVERTLHKLRQSNDARMHALELLASESSKKPRRTSAPKKKPDVAASMYVSKMKLSSDIHTVLLGLAGKFEDKTFLPTLGDVRNFCTTHNVDERSISSRVSAIPRIFGFLATLETEDIQRILHSDVYTGPSRLAPIADAIRRSSEQRMEKEHPNERATNPSSTITESEEPIPSKPSVPTKI